MDAVLRLRVCGRSGCRALFTICASCDRGQRYCSPACRAGVRCRQRHDASLRYQQSKQGREAHGRCQQRYREGTAGAPVTDQIKVPRRSHRRQPHCAVASSAAEKAGGSIHSRPSHADGGPAEFQKSTFSDDRQRVALTGSRVYRKPFPSLDLPTRPWNRLEPGKPWCT
jgi:hypothetical protein